MASVRFADSTTPTHHRFPSIEHIPRPQSTHLDLRYPARYLTLSHDTPAVVDLKAASPPLRTPAQTAPRPSLQARPRRPAENPEPHRTLRQAAPSFKTLVETIDAFPCPLEDKLTLVAKLHAEVEAELTQLSELAGPPLASTYLDYADRSSGHSRKKIEDTVRFIKHADRIKAHALQQLKQDISHSQTPALHPALPAHSHHHPSHQAPAAHSSSRLALLSRELH
ncbi:hypothetical protein PtA15_12A290 [Puccinia triticina]|uniref:Uncharacterized protein n=1 Tax=Puccinia triticina TaxID=208348 RepID=A0ABY7D205_9BASI|nr:uncharacterized protein PtA15_12A290 [Puccinia triticina]WAQ90302.1 hypothetical protein PtA15_12A290 [Puccinia triticina]WAR61608.1 hypothetical protein PtB15_12B298 [Puccinia triticina]